MNLHVNVLAVKVVRVRGIGRGESTVTTEHCAPTFGAAAWGVAQASVILRAADHSATRGIPGASVELGDAQIVVKLLPSAGQAHSGDICSPINPAVVAKVNGLDSGAIVIGNRDNHVVVRVGRRGGALPLA